jgi:hypothetical protein
MKKRDTESISSVPFRFQVDRKDGSFRDLNFNDIAIPQLMLFSQLYIAGDFDRFSRCRLAVGFVRPLCRVRY